MSSSYLYIANREQIFNGTSTSRRIRATPSVRRKWIAASSKIVKLYCLQEEKRQKNFLVIEDKAEDADLIRKAFGTLQTCHAFVCRNLSEGRAYVQGSGMYRNRELYPFPNAVICDNQLGGESGVEFVKWLKSTPEFQNLPVIVLSSVSDTQFLTAKKLGAVDVFRKPDRFEELQRMLADLAAKLCVWIYDLPFSDGEFVFVLGARFLDRLPRSGGQGCSHPRNLFGRTGHRASSPQAVKFLIVNDSMLSRRMMRKCLEDLGHSVMEASDGAQALERYVLETPKPDFVMLDLVMPGMDGFEALTMLWKLDPDSWVIICSADIQTITREKVKADGALAIIAKPVSIEQISAILTWRFQRKIPGKKKETGVVTCGRSIRARNWSPTPPPR
jgi:two-component system chemotaxis response regulator CheY